MMDTSYCWFAASYPISCVQAFLTESNVALAEAGIVSENPIAFQPWKSCLVGGVWIGSRVKWSGTSVRDVENIQMPSSGLTFVLAVIGVHRLPDASYSQIVWLSVPTSLKIIAVLFPLSNVLGVETKFQPGCRIME